MTEHYADDDWVTTEINQRVKKALAEVTGSKTRVQSEGPIIWITGKADELDMEVVWRALEMARVGLLGPVCLDCQKHADEIWTDSKPINPRDFCLATLPFILDCGGYRP
jgi:hypothetical protein